MFGGKGFREEAVEGSSGVAEEGRWGRCHILATSGIHIQPVFVAVVPL
jgi:hypothetical protein